MDRLHGAIDDDREQTDASLEAERARSDAAVVEAAAAARRVADDAIERDRQRAEAAMRTRREDAPRMADERRAPESVAARRARTDAQLAEERRRADDVLLRLGAEERTLRLTQAELSRRRDLLAIVAHDLRNPLAIIGLNAQLLDAAAPTDDMRQWADEVARAAGRMNRLVSDLLDVAFIDAESFTLSCEDTDVARLLDETHASYAPLFAARGLALRKDDDGVDRAACGVFADRERLSQVLSNLLGNAMKFTPAGGAVRLGLAAPPGHVEIEVEDSGPGIPAERLPLVRRRFWHADDAAPVEGSERRGLGLGLYIVETIVDAHHGELLIESERGHGTRVRVRLPRATR